MFRVALICFTKSGIRQIRISTTSETMDRPHAAPLSLLKIRLKNE